MEMQAQMIVQKGFNGYRASFAAYCTKPNGFFGKYNASQLHRSIEIAAHYGLWIVVDYHGNNDVQTDSNTVCWLSFWRGVVQQFTAGYDRIIWEPLNEPNATYTAASLKSVSSAYQQWVDQARSIGDDHWIVIENLCSFSCGLPVADSWKAFPTVNDPAGRLFISLHAYFEYRYHYSEWSNATADTYARAWVVNMLDGAQSTGWPVLNTEGGPGRPFGRLTNGTMVTCPDLILNGSSGYCKTNFHFIQTMTTLLDNQTTMLQSRLNWLWFPMADWSSTPGAGIYGSLSPSGPGWGTILSYKKAPAPLSLTLNATPNRFTIYPGTSKTSLIAINSTGFDGITSLTTIATASGPTTSLANPSLQMTAGGSNTTTLTISVPAGTAVGVYEIRVTSLGGVSGSRAIIVDVTVEDFAMRLDPPKVHVLPGQRQDFHVSLESLGNFDDNVIISVTSDRSESNITIFPLSVTVKPGQTSNATLSFNSTVAGDYNVTVAGRTGSLSHFANVSITVSDFKISLNILDSTIPTGTNRTLTVHLSSLSDFSGTLTLIVNVSPSGPGVVISPSQVNLTSGEIANANLSIDLPSSVSPGSYTVTIGVTGGGIYHRTTLSLLVTSPLAGPSSQPQFTIIGLQPLQFVGIVSLAVGLGTLLAYKGTLSRRARFVPASFQTRGSIVAGGEAALVFGAMFNT